MNGHFGHFKFVQLKSNSDFVNCGQIQPISFCLPTIVYCCRHLYHIMECYFFASFFHFIFSFPSFLTIWVIVWSCWVLSGSDLSLFVLLDTPNSIILAFLRFASINYGTTRYNSMVYSPVLSCFISEKEKSLQIWVFFFEHGQCFGGHLLAPRFRLALSVARGFPKRHTSCLKLCLAPGGSIRYRNLLNDLVHVIFGQPEELTDFGDPFLFVGYSQFRNGLRD